MEELKKHDWNLPITKIRQVCSVHITISKQNNPSLVEPN